MECKYEHQLSVLGEGTPEELKAAWDAIQLQCVVLMGISPATANLEINIVNTSNRINAVKSWIFIQRDCLRRFGYPLPELLPEFNKYNHKISYSGDNAALLDQLQTIENKEREYNMLLTKDKKRLENLRIAEGKESDFEDSRVHFIKLINSLSESIGFHIDRDKMTVEEFFILFAEKIAAAKASKSN